MGNNSQDTPQTPQQQRMRQYMQQGREEGMRQSEEDARASFIGAAELAAARNNRKGNPVNPKAYASVVRIYQEEWDKIKAQRESIEQMPPAEQEAALAKLNKNFSARLKSRISAVPDGMKAWMESGSASQEDNLVSKTVKVAYDSDRGGIQWGGIGGLLLGGFAIFNMTSSFTPLVNILATAAGALVLANVAHSFIDNHDPVAKPDFHTKTPKPGDKYVAAQQHLSFEEIMKNSKPVAPEGTKVASADLPRPGHTPPGAPAKPGQGTGVTA